MEDTPEHAVDHEVCGLALSRETFHDDGFPQLPVQQAASFESVLCKRAMHHQAGLATGGSRALLGGVESATVHRVSLFPAAFQRWRGRRRSSDIREAIQDKIRLMRLRAAESSDPSTVRPTAERTIMSLQGGNYKIGWARTVEASSNMVGGSSCHVFGLQKRLVGDWYCL